MCILWFFFLMIRRPPRSTQGVSSAASDVYKRQVHGWIRLNTNGSFLFKIRGRVSTRIKRLKFLNPFLPLSQPEQALVLLLPIRQQRPMVETQAQILQKTVDAAFAQHCFQIFGNQRCQKFMTQILIVDDEEKLRNLLSMMLERKGMKTHKAIHGANALEMLEHNSYDLIISDIKMPVMDGRQLISKMREKHILTPVIFITAFATIESAVEMMQQGACDYITKPFDSAKIYLAVEKAINLSRLITKKKKKKKKKSTLR
eukprot:TRINITY_DN51592_c0_g1_i2.p1 TRINITY_DN51592_c0_g1~~TRINITY_DN51592_c0_g1_i2.p1  ORF type:complete len:258 (+),score=35.40 TRINITY_DN51592_c0_g1_i2:106-879(+)